MATTLPTTSIEANNLFNVNGLVAVITGGGSGLGAMMARALAVNGAKKVYIIGRREEKLKEVAASVDTKNIIPIVGDVTSKESLAAAAAQVQAETGYINVLIANSGTNGPSNRPNPDGPLEEFQKQAWEVGFDEYNDTFKLNVTATWFTVIAFLGLLDQGNKRAERGEGEGPNVKSQVIAVSSLAGASRIMPVGAWYGQSKAAVTHLVKQLATGFVGYGIRVNAIAPGLYPSEMTDVLFERIGADGWKKSFVPEERPGSVEDMSGAILFLTSRAGAYLNGLVLLTDGGRLSVLPSTY